MSVDYTCPTVTDRQRAYVSAYLDHSDHLAVVMDMVLVWASSDESYVAECRMTDSTWRAVPMTNRLLG